VSIPCLFSPGFGVDEFADVRQEFIHCLRTLIGVFAVADRHGVVFGFAVSHYQHVGNFLELGIADFQIHFFAALVQGDAQHDGLGRSQLHQKRPSGMFDQNPEEAPEMRNARTSRFPFSLR
jgi:hypothetical protein